MATEAAGRAAWKGLERPGIQVGQEADVQGDQHGGLRVELKVRNTVGIVDLNHDPDAEPPADPPDPDWDEGEEQRHFLAPTFYLEGRPAALAEQQRVVARLAPAELAQLTALMAKLGVGWVNARSATLSCGLFESLFDRGEILGLVSVLHHFAAQLEQEGEQIAPAPGVVLGGVAVNPRLVAKLQTCHYCNANVELGPERKCPNCGARL